MQHSWRGIVMMIVVVCSAVGAHAQSSSGKHIIIPKGMERSYDNYHYAPVVRVGDMVIVSGIPAGGADTYEGKIRNMFERAKAHLAAAGATMSDVVELTTFHAEVRDAETFQQEFAKFLVIHKEYFPDAYPAWTAVGTTALLAPGAPVEMRLLAMIGAGKESKVERATP